MNYQFKTKVHIRLQHIATLPENVTVVVQVKKFESWLISDPDSLKNANIISPDALIPDDIETIVEPVKWIKENLLRKEKVTTPSFTRKLTKHLDPEVMRTKSKSFDKFYRECWHSYEIWLDKQ